MNISSSLSVTFVGIDKVNLFSVEVKGIDFFRKVTETLYLKVLWSIISL